VTPLPWISRTFSGVELIADYNGVTIITDTSVRLTNAQLASIGESIREHLDCVDGGEVDTNSPAWKRAYYGIE
jgi:hypothetical protein